ncbi:MAG: MMPL family transporter [Oscillospiraceae bacterium]|nr:MMPL family transporter [Oscillospiraceae bacterium]
MAEEKKNEIMRRIAAGIIRSRILILFLFLGAAVYCALSVGRVRLSSDLTAFLPADTETRRGLSIMEEEFITYASAEIMVSNIPYETALNLAEQISALDAVTGVGFDSSPSHYRNSAALFSVSFSGEKAGSLSGSEDDPAVLSAMQEIRSLLSPYDAYYNTDIGVNYFDQLASEMVGIILIAAAVIMAILLFTSRSYFEVVIFFIVFVFAALLNMGTNFWLGEISSITNSIAIILQLALAIDYAIIFAHRYQDEAALRTSVREALTESLAQSIPEIAASSLTTISGLVALMLMQFRLGYDLGIVLAKAIVCSMLTVFLLMPGLILFFPRALKRTLHKNLVPDIYGWGRFLMHSGYFFVWIFLLLIPLGIFFSRRVDYAFSESSVSELVYSESRAAMHKVHDSFAPSTYVALLVPAEDFEAEKSILKEAAALDGIKDATGLAGIEVKPGLMLTDSCTPRIFAELLNLSYEEAALLFQAYGVRHEQYQAIFSSVDRYEVPLIDMFLYLFSVADRGVVELPADRAAELEELRGTLERGIRQLRGENWNRLVFTSSLPVEGDASVALVEELRDIAERHYGRGKVLVVGDITSARDLSASYTGDSTLISLLTILFVFTILLFTFRTVVGSAILVFVIQGSIWFNFSFPALRDQHPSFVTNMIVSAIQMGATIDYAIVLMSRYLALKEGLPKKDAMAEAVKQSFPTVMTSGSIMTIAGLLIAFRVSDVYVGHIGLGVGRGALISVILVLTVLPQLLVLLDRAVEKTTLNLGLPDEKEEHRQADDRPQVKEEA